jgi:GTP-binding protein YchF
MSNISVGIVGLPNVGKSTLFNALLKKQQALAANYPFATIEPNVGIVAVPDQRLKKIAEITKAEEKMAELPPLKPATVEFVDIAGLVKGASEGAGLGNKFLSHIREVSVIAHVVRAFADENVIREGSTTPEDDYKTIETELMIADLQSLEKQRESKAVKTDKTKAAVIEKLIAGLNNYQPVREVHLNDEEHEHIRDLFLLSAKPELTVLNIAEDEYNPGGIQAVMSKYSELLNKPTSSCVVICAKIEAELAALSEEEQKEYLQGLDLDTSGLERLIQKAYGTLGLISFLTTGEKEARAWTVKKGASKSFRINGVDLYPKTA